MAKKKKKMEFETMPVKLPHVKGLSIVLPVIYILWVAVMYYLLLPALNIHSRGLWLFVLGVILFPLGIIGALVSAARKAEGKSAGKQEKPVNGRLNLVLAGKHIVSSRVETMCSKSV